MSARPICGCGHEHRYYHERPGARAGRWCGVGLVLLLLLVVAWMTA